LAAPASGLRAQAEVCRANGRAGREEHAAFHRMIELPNVAWPGHAHEEAFMAAGSKTGNVFCG